MDPNAISILKEAKEDCVLIHVNLCFYNLSSLQDTTYLLWLE